LIQVNPSPCQAELEQTHIQMNYVRLDWIILGGARVKP